MSFIEYLSSFASITGVSLITIIAALFPFFSKRLTRNRFYFTKKTIFKCTRGFIEPIYEINGEMQTEKIIKKLKKMIFNYPICKIIYIIGDSGVGKTNLTNSFIWKCDTFSRLKGKNIIRIFGLECENILETLRKLENKENTILIIDSLEEAYIYKKNNILELSELNEELLYYYSVLITINRKFYIQNNRILDEVYYRDADLKKIFPFTLFLHPFSDDLIIKYINKNINLSKRKKRYITNKAIQYKEIFSNPLLLSYIAKIDLEKEQFSSLFMILEHIFKADLSWERNKYSKAKESERRCQEVLNIMNRISWSYINGKRPAVKSALKVNSNLLCYDKHRQEYKFSHNLFLYYKIVQRFYSKLARNKAFISRVLANHDLKYLYFEKIDQHHFHLINENKNIVLVQGIIPVLEIRDVCIFKERWLLGLSKSLLECDVFLCDIILDAYQIYGIAKHYLLQGNLELQGIEIDEKQLVWWSALPIKSLNISNTRVHNIVIPDSWANIQTFHGENLQIESCSSLGKLTQLKELSLSGVQVNTIRDLQELTKLPDGISVDLAYCGITNDNIPNFLLETKFEKVFLDYNRLQKPDFIWKMKFQFLDLSNNPIKFDEEEYLRSKKVQCNFYFESEEITNFLCENEIMLTYEQAVNIKSVDLSNLQVKNLKGLENLPNLTTLIISIYQMPMIDDIFANSKLTKLVIKMYGLRVIASLRYFCPSLKTIITNSFDYGAVCISIKHIMDYTASLLESYWMECRLAKSGNLETKCAVTKGTDSLVKFMNIELGLFLRRVVDVFNYAIKFWDGDIEREYLDLKYSMVEKERPLRIGDKFVLNYENIAKTNYDEKLSELYDLMGIQPVEAIKSEYSLLDFFTPIHNVLAEGAYAQVELETILFKQVGKKINIDIIN